MPSNVSPESPVLVADPGLVAGDTREGRRPTGLFILGEADMPSRLSVVFASPKGAPYVRLDRLR